LPEPSTAALALRFDRQPTRYCRVAHLDQTDSLPLDPPQYAHRAASRRLLTSEWQAHTALPHGRHSTRPSKPSPPGSQTALCPIRRRNAAVTLTAVENPNTRSLRRCNSDQTSSHGEEIETVREEIPLKDYSDCER